MPSSRRLPPSANITWGKLTRTGSHFSLQKRASPSTQSQIICSPYLMMPNHFPEYLPLPQLQKAMQHLAAHAFHPGTSRNHTLQVQSFIQFCNRYHISFLDPDISTMCLYITHLTRRFSSARSIHNYVSRVRTLYKEIGLTPVALGSFQVFCLLGGGRYLHANATPYDVFPSFPHCSITSAPSLPTWGPLVQPCGCASPSVSLPC